MGSSSENKFQEQIRIGVLDIIRRPHVFIIVFVGLLVLALLEAQIKTAGRLDAIEIRLNEIERAHGQDRSRPE